MSRLRPARWLLLAAMLSGAGAQGPATQDPDATTAAIQQQLEAAKADATLAPELKTALLEAWGKAVEEARKADAAAAEAERYAALGAAAPASLQQARAQLAELEQQAIGPATSVTAAQLEAGVHFELPVLEQGLLKAQQDQAANQRAAADLEKELTRRSERRTSLPAQFAALRQRLEGLPVLAADTPGVDARLATARRTLRFCERRFVQTQIDAANAEIAAFDAEEELLRARRDLGARQATWDKNNIEAWQQQVQVVRTFVAQRAAAEAARQADAARSANPLIARLADENDQLARKLATLSSVTLPRAERDAAETTAELQRLEREFEAIKKRVATVGEIDEVGELLRDRQVKLSESKRDSPARARDRRAQLADALLNHFNYDERRLRLVADPDGWPAEEFGDGDQAQLSDDARAAARQLRTTRLAALTRLSDDYISLWKSLNEVDTAEHQLAALGAAYREFLAQHVLGIRSSLPIWEFDPGAVAAELAWLADPAGWVDVGRQLVHRLALDIWPLALLTPLLALLLLRPFCRRRLSACGDLAGRGTTVAYAPTAQALLWSLMLAAPIPLLVWFASARLGSDPDLGGFSRALAAGARHVVLPLSVLMLLRVILRPKGLGEAHFRWQPTTIKHLRASMPLMVICAFPLAFVFGTLVAHRGAAFSSRLGMLVLAAILTLLAVVAFRMLHPLRGIAGGVLQGQHDNVHRFRWLWFLLGFGTTLVLLGMALLGYDYTAGQLARRLLATVTVVTIGAVVYALIVRALVLERRRLQIRRAQERMQAAKAAGGTTTATEATAVAEELDPQHLTRQTQTLLRGAITIAVLVIAYQIWVDVLPALAIFDRVPLWTDHSGTPPVEITLADLLLSLVVLILCSAAARNLPALLELLVLQRLAIPSGERKAIATLAKYGIFIVGLLLAFSTIGVGWSKVQWLVAAVSVGLGFGLQEIFANFVSGLILLFERPARIGDLVTVGEVTGRVTKIQIRATTIQDFDRKEMIVPNREFVTSRFVNWTLTDSVVRWTLAVGVAYGTDTKQALDLLLRAARESRWVLADPPPEVQFVRFGDSTLDLELRVYLDMSTVEIAWRTELHQAIDRLFREHGITIAFPQREVHLHAAGPLLERLRGDDIAAGERR